MIKTKSPIVTQHKRGTQSNVTRKWVWKSVSLEWYSHSMPMTPPSERATKSLSVFEKSYGIIHFGLVKRFGRSGLTTWEAFAILLFCSNVNSIPNYRLYYQNSLFPYSIYSAKEQSSYCNIQPTHFVCLCGNTLHNNSLNHPQK